MSITTAWRKHPQKHSVAGAEGVYRRFDHKAQLDHLKTLPVRARVVRVLPAGGYALLVTHTPLYRRLPHPMMCGMDRGDGWGRIIPTIGQALVVQRYYTEGLIALDMLYPIARPYALTATGEAQAMLARHDAAAEWADDQDLYS